MGVDVYRVLTVRHAIFVEEKGDAFDEETRFVLTLVVDLYVA
jgi:hypothetical protein